MPIPPHMTPEARARRKWLAESFDRNVQTPEQADKNARAMLASLKARGTWVKAPPQMRS